VWAGSTYGTHCCATALPAGPRYLIKGGYAATLGQLVLLPSDWKPYHYFTLIGLTAQQSTLTAWL